MLRSKASPECSSELAPLGNISGILRGKGKARWIASKRLARQDTRVSAVYRQQALTAFHELL